MVTVLATTAVVEPTTLIFCAVMRWCNVKQAHQWQVYVSLGQLRRHHQRLPVQLLQQQQLCERQLSRRQLRRHHQRLRVQLLQQPELREREISLGQLQRHHQRLSVQLLQQQQLCERQLSLGQLRRHHQRLSVQLLQQPELREREISLGQLRQHHQRLHVQRPAILRRRNNPGWGNVETERRVFKLRGGKIYIQRRLRRLFQHTTLFVQQRRVSVPLARHISTMFV